jgi:hypothetical protein
VRVPDISAFLSRLLLPITSVANPTGQPGKHGRRGRDQTMHLPHDLQADHNWRSHLHRMDQRAAETRTIKREGYLTARAVH